MTDKEFKRLSRAQLMDIIYQLQLKVDELTDRNRELETALADKRLRLSNAGNIADAALEMNNCLRSAQNAAEHYLEEIRAMHTEAEAQRQKILTDAREEAAAILAKAHKTQGDFDSAVEAILREYGQTSADNR